jgi:hypothetical protein
LGGRFQPEQVVAFAGMLINRLSLAILSLIASQERPWSSRTPTAVRGYGESAVDAGRVPVDVLGVVTLPC